MTTTTTMDWDLSRAKSSSLNGCGLILDHEPPAQAPVVSAELDPGLTADGLLLRCRFTMIGGHPDNCAIIIGLSDKPPEDLRMAGDIRDLILRGSNSILLFKPIGSIRWLPLVSPDTSFLYAARGTRDEYLPEAGQLMPGTTVDLQIRTFGNGDTIDGVSWYGCGQQIARRTFASDSERPTLPMRAIVGLISQASSQSRSQSRSHARRYHTLILDGFRVTQSREDQGQDSVQKNPQPV